MDNKERIKITLDRFKLIKDEAENDCKFDKSQIESSFDTTSKKIKWIKKKTEWTSALRKLEVQRKEKYRNLYEFYYREFPLKLNTKDEYQLFIESDPNYVDINELCLLLKEIVQFVDTVLDILKDRGWEIKNAIEWQKFINGQ